MPTESLNFGTNRALRVGVAVPATDLEYWVESKSSWAPWNDALGTSVSTDGRRILMRKAGVRCLNLGFYVPA